MFNVVLLVISASRCIVPNLEVHATLRQQAMGNRQQAKVNVGENKEGERERARESERGSDYSTKKVCTVARQIHGSVGRHVRQRRGVGEHAYRVGQRF